MERTVDLGSGIPVTGTAQIAASSEELGGSTRGDVWEAVSEPHWQPQQAKVIATTQMVAFRTPTPNFNACRLGGLALQVHALQDEHSSPWLQLFLHGCPVLRAVPFFITIMRLAFIIVERR